MEVLVCPPILYTSTQDTELELPLGIVYFWAIKKFTKLEISGMPFASRTPPVWIQGGCIFAVILPGWNQLMPIDLRTTNKPKENLYAVASDSNTLVIAQIATQTISMSLPHHWTCEFEYLQYTNFIPLYQTLILCSSKPKLTLYWMSYQHTYIS